MESGIRASPNGAKENLRQRAPEGRQKRRSIISAFLRQAGVNAESFGGFAQLLIFCPQERGRIDENGSDQVCVGQTNAEAVQMKMTGLNQGSNFVQLRHSHLR